MQIEDYGCWTRMKKVKGEPEWHIGHIHFDIGSKIKAYAHYKNGKCFAYYPNIVEYLFEQNSRWYRGFKR